MDNTKMSYSELKIGDVGEKAARRLVAEHFSRMEHHPSGLMDIVDLEGNKYRAIYIRGEYQELFSADNEYEKAVLELYQSRGDGKGKGMPYIEFREMD